MKTLIALLFSSLMTISPLFAQEDYFVAADKLPETDFSQYKTYDWSSFNKFKYYTFYSLNDISLKSDIINAIESELTGLGFETASNPDVMVNFMVFEKPTKFKGYKENNDPANDYLHDYFLSMEPKGDLITKEYEFQEGTLLIQMVEVESGNMIWQGYASGIMDNNIFNRKKDNIEEAVELIFEKYPARADQFESTGR
ncbi:DUF4136 domain-containing protein [Flexithrix dorotheae]|uniref:DUF4136 domain-containing protein n=1 Tax=Flexithrix dorotheae TaxID=70993 RepID=UPI00036BB90C|nr:DUF4136 domain-containing protein [Flexithrix dorotheae]